LSRAAWLDEATSIGYTFATLGLLAGLFGGMALINLGARLGWTGLVHSPEEPGHAAEADERSGFLPEPQPSLVRHTTSAMAVDPLTWHIALVLVGFAGAHGVNHLWQNWGPGVFSLPLFAASMLIGGALQKVLDGLGVGTYVDRQFMSRIGSCAADYLVA